MCEGVDLLKQWKQGNTCFGRAIKDPLSGVFFLCKFFASIYFPVSFQGFLLKNLIVQKNELLSKYFLFGSIISFVGKDVI